MAAASQSGWADGAGGMAHSESGADQGAPSVRLTVLDRRCYIAEAMPLPGFIAPCLPTKAKEPPRGGAWLHEIKHDGFRVIARKDGDRVRLYSRPGNDLTYRFPLTSRP
jgi:ATP-dependent DNA ligase